MTDAVTVCPGCNSPCAAETVKYYDGELTVSTCCGWEVEHK